MTNRLPPRLPALFWLLSAAACAPAPEPGPALILTGGRIYPTADPAVRVSAIAIDGDRVVALGTDAEIRALAGNLTQEMELDEAAVLPGFHDAWVDIEALGRWPRGFDLSRAATPREVQARLREAAASDAGEWIQGWGWDESRWPRQELPGHETLDAAVSGRAVVLWHRTEAIAWLNATAMQQSGLSGSGVDGLVLDGDGDWTGLVVGPAITALRRRLPVAGADLRRQWIGDGLRDVAAAGITSLATAPLDSGALDALRRLQADDEIGPRVEVRLRAEADPSSARRPTASSLDVAAIGIEADGPFGPRLAWLSSPYADTATPGPEPDLGRLDRACELASSRGLRLDVHVHGDAALAAALRCPLIAQGRGLIVGADLAGPALDFQAAQVAAVPSRLAHDLYFLEARLGAARARSAHAYRSLITAGRLTAFASIAPRYSLSPMSAAWIAWRRQDLESYPLDGWFGRERIAVADAFRAALGAQWRERAASLEPGENADLVVWSVDPYEDSERTLLRARAMVTIVGGRVIFSRALVEPNFERVP